MYCVNCGSILYNENQVGLVCQSCKQAREKKRRGEEQPLSIRYCFRCGKPYQPHDSSIQHLFCPSEKGLATHSSAFLSEQEITPELRKDTHVLL
jgi:NMD protein affecting ribosome stability and mRNA decay